MERLPVDGFDGKAGRILPGTQWPDIFCSGGDRNISVTVLNGQATRETHHHRPRKEPEEHFSDRFSSRAINRHGRTLFVNTSYQTTAPPDLLQLLVAQRVDRVEL